MKSPLNPRSGRALPGETLTLTPSKQRPPRPPPKENVDPNAMPPPESSPFRPSSAAGKPLAARNRSPLQARPPPPSSNPVAASNNPLKRKLSAESLLDSGAPLMPSPDSGVQVIVRMRPPSKEEEGDQIVKKICSDSVSILDHVFTFDSVADNRSTQHDIFNLVGLPLVENCLAGFNSSIFAYGQTGSGKTYTMWGPPSALLDESSLGEQRGLTPRVFDRLFSRIKEEQAKHSDKQLSYQCRCSFLEIYNEQITDLLDPTQKNLQIREDTRTGVYVDCLTEEYVSTMKEVLQLLTKGLANRRTGATSINVESSRSHCVFTCVVESRSKSVADGSSSLRTSRINLVDLAGSERQKLTGAAGERLKEAGNINRSLSQLGNLINILAEVSQSGKQRHIPYRDSKLTFLLQESLGGNAKLAMICAISPSQSCRSETFSTLRFAQRAKVIKNKAIINEVTQDDVNALREQIRQLKDELIRMKSNGTSAESNGSYSDGWNARHSLKLLRMSLNHPTALPVVETDSDEEMEIDEDNAEKGHLQQCEISMSGDKNEVLVQNPAVQLEHLKKVRLYSDDEIVQDHALPFHLSGSVNGSEQVSNLSEIIMECSEREKLATGKGEGCDIENAASASEEYVRRHTSYKMIKLVTDNSLDDVSVEKTEEEIFIVPDNNSLGEGSCLVEKASACLENASGSDTAKVSLVSSSHKSFSSSNSIMLSSLSIVPCQISPVLQSPSLSISPRLEPYSRKSPRTTSSVSASQKNMLINTKSDSGVHLSFADTLNNDSNSPVIQTSSNSMTPTEHLAASLNRGLQIIDNCHQSSALRRSSFRFSTKPIDLSPLQPTVKVDTGTQTFPQESDGPEDLRTFICGHCKSGTLIEPEDVDYGMNLQLVQVDGSQSAKKSIKQVPKVGLNADAGTVVEKVLTGAIRREMALEDLCAKQASEIAHLNRLVEQYKHERECNSIIGQTREDKISRLESLMDGILSTEGFREEESISLANEHELLKEKYENHPEVLRVNIELKRVQEELDEYRNFFDLGERDLLIEEVQDLRNQLQYYMDCSSLSPQNRSPLLKLTCPSEVISAPLSIISELNEENANERLEQERHHWVEAESQWISLTEELRLEVEEHRSLAEKRKRELDSERKCAEELKEALQTAMQGHARILEQFADLQEKHLAMHERCRKITDGIADVKKAAAKAGVKGAESKFINSLAAEISALKVDRERERQYWRNENKGLQCQLRDTAEAVQAAGELLVRLKEAEAAANIAQKRALVAEQQTAKAYQEIDKLKKDYERKIATLNQFLADSRLPKEALRPTFNDANEAKYDGRENFTDHRWKEEFKPFFEGGENEFSRGDEPHLWHSGYDRCNI